MCGGNNKNLKEKSFYHSDYQTEKSRPLTMDLNSVLIKTSETED